MSGQKLTIKNATIILSLIAVVLLVIYFAVLWPDYQSKIRQYSSFDLESSIEVEEIKANQLNNMRNEIANASDENLGSIEVYNNQSNEIRLLDEILSGTRYVSITWSNPTLQNSIVRRKADISFTVESYAEAQALIEDIYDSQYRLIINSIVIDGDEELIEVVDDETFEVSMENAPINVSLTVTFFETTVGADDLSGLEVITTTTSNADILDYDMFD